MSRETELKRNDHRIVHEWKTNDKQFCMSVDGIWARVNNDKRGNATALFDGTMLPDAESRAQALCDELNGVKR